MDLTDSCCFEIPEDPRVKKLEEKIDRLVGYARHLERCASLDKSATTYACDCGLDKLIYSSPS